jgi:TetR/AcrR family transcriptional regulator, fatty acid metabolism regulator protein
MLRVYIESNLAYIGSHRRAITALKQIVTNLRTADGSLRYVDAADETSVRGVAWILDKGQQDGLFRAFDTRVMALTIRAAIDTAASQLEANHDLDPAPYAHELVALFDRATRATV